MILKSLAQKFCEILIFKLAKTAGWLPIFHFPPFLFGKEHLDFQLGTKPPEIKMDFLVFQPRMTRKCYLGLLGIVIRGRGNTCFYVFLFLRMWLDVMPRTWCPLYWWSHPRPWGGSRALRVMKQQEETGLYGFCEATLPFLDCLSPSPVLHERETIWLSSYFQTNLNDV